MSTISYMTPYEILNTIMSFNTKPTPTALLIKYRFGDRYDGIRTIYEINLLKEEMEKSKKKYDEVCCQSRKERNECYKIISEQEELCAQLKKSNGACFGCFHWKIIEEHEEYVEDYYRMDSEYKSKYEEAEHEYRKELSKKEGWIDEFNEECERDYDDWREREYNMYYS